MCFCQLWFPFSWVLLCRFVPYRNRTLSTCEGWCRTETQCVFMVFLFFWWCRYWQTGLRAGSRFLKDTGHSKVEQNVFSSRRHDCEDRECILCFLDQEPEGIKRCPAELNASATREHRCCFLLTSAVADSCRKVWHFNIYAANYRKVKLLNWGK